MDPSHGCQFTVCTPTFNRVRSLIRVWDSLRVQTLRSFEWLVVDDGSTDGTREQVAAWALEADFPVRYLWQPNQHKKTAMNHAAREAHGEFFTCLDSDDACLPTALERFAHHWQQIPQDERPQFAGLTMLCQDVEGRIIGDRFPCDMFLDSSGAELMHRWHVQGEKWGFVRTRTMQQFPFPEDVRGYVPESYVWRQIDGLYRTRYVNEVARIYYRDQADSLMTVRTVSVEENADGGVLGFAMDLRAGARWLRHDPMGLGRIAVLLVRLALHSKLPAKRLMNEVWNSQPATARLLLLAALPAGVLLWVRDHVRKYLSGRRHVRQGVTSGSKPKGGRQPAQVSPLT